MASVRATKRIVAVNRGHQQRHTAATTTATTTTPPAPLLPTPPLPPTWRHCTSLTVFATFSHGPRPPPSHTYSVEQPAFARTFVSLNGRFRDRRCTTAAAVDAAAAAPVAANPLLTARTCRSNTHDHDRGIARARLPHDGLTSAIFGSLRRFTLTFRAGTTILWAHRAPRPRFLSNDSCATLTYTHFNSCCFKKPSRPLYRMNLQNIWTLPHENVIGLKLIRNKLLSFE
ncbi:hypothetical protein HZU73_01325 [Apis mellifera caucasica]|uniref:Uncharacterized protein LOC107966086 n=1 Tax=Apis mellifera TaxID=7460 RepID=A0A7M7L898_APIME|nr:uncharacterized protein LOC107966086 [Apis mellifera]KAG6803406.1 hypothetical protein HZU73_01325 [Apis mellifera caucasica]KAG9435368.1 hypothetical protein HZU67_03353 [Apis mellifera carnica]|eukprot:XP_026294959.1 uncharacterized protein LOC107966086 [Apis mellifera]